MRSSPFRIAALVLLGALLATNFYRAATQSIVHDEAFTWQLYLSGPASAIFQEYSPNNHFLATVLFRVSTTLFGPSEFAMRLPTVLAGAWFFWTVFRLCGLVLGDSWLFLLACAALTLNPLLLDFLVAARGYGLAMAGLFWALFQMLSWFRDQSQGVAENQLRKRLWKAAIGCSIAVAANLTFVIPVFVLAAAFCVLVVRTGKNTGAPSAAHAVSKARKKGKKLQPNATSEPARPFAPLLHFIVPVAVLAIAFLLAAPIDLARGEDFYAGIPRAMKSLQNLTESSFAYGVSSGVMQVVEQAWSKIALVFLPLMTMAALIAVATIKPRLYSVQELATGLASLAVIGSAFLLLAAHFLAGVLYPEDRTGIYFIPLASLAALGLVRILADRPGWPRWTSFAVAILLLSFAAEFAAQWNVKSFLVWRYDADTKHIFQALESAPKPSGPIRLGVSWVFEPALNYYREVRNANWMTPVERDGFSGARQFYIVSVEDQPNAPWPQLKEIYRGPVSGTVLAVPRSVQ